MHKNDPRAAAGNCKQRPDNANKIHLEQTTWQVPRIRGWPKVRARDWCRDGTGGQVAMDAMHPMRKTRTRKRTRRRRRTRTRTWPMASLLPFMHWLAATPRRPRRRTLSFWPLQQNKLQCNAKSRMRMLKTKVNGVCVCASVRVCVHVICLLRLENDLHLLVCWKQAAAASGREASSASSASTASTASTGQHRPGTGPDRPGLSRELDMLRSSRSMQLHILLLLTLMSPMGRLWRPLPTGGGSRQPTCNLQLAACNLRLPAPHKRRLLIRNCNKLQRQRHEPCCHSLWLTGWNLSRKFIMF